MRLTFLTEGPEFQIRDECTGYHNGQSDCRLLAFDGDEFMGALWYVVFGGEISISNLDVLPEHRRRGVATALARHLCDVTGKSWDEIDKGYASDQGSAFLGAFESDEAYRQEGLREGHWEVVGGHPGSLGPKRRRKGQYSPHARPKDIPGWRTRMTDAAQGSDDKVTSRVQGRQY